MRKVNVKKNTITWAFVGLIAFVAAIISIVLIVRISRDIETITSVQIWDNEIQPYRAYKAYGIGILSFSSVVLVISSIITYLGIKSWNYSATL
ncbi:hypothetical protein MCFN_02245 [Mycoplasmopsis californica]|uniref:Uncharacterized protein n=1 Tax=Mycoplasmopsis californica TaxID=2113 RepID=A0A059XW82_9BACT|nr:hypothetical protein [Mycoplasmopsis californica]AIA29586.1 hypothetical protein MCFN_02245 [Mycoplasmopsis californica]